MTENWEQWEGQVVDGRFPLLRRLGGSGPSAVFATAGGDAAIPDAAIKLVETTPEEAERLLARWTAAAALSHPHLLPLYEAGRCQLDGKQLIYLVMERADDNLEQVLAQRPLSAAETIETLGPVLDALAYLHAQGFVHGHLRPSAMRAVGDQLKLASEGLRRVGESRGAPAEADVYGAPEAELAPAADVWSLGVTLVEALTQRALPTPTLPPEVPAPLGEIVRRCLERDPARRWTVARIRARLAHPASAAPAEAKLRNKLPRRRILQLAVAAALLLAAIVASPLLFSRRREVEPPAVIPQPARQVLPAPAQEPGDVAGAVLQRVLPEVLPAARRSIRGSVKVSVKVRVDPAGKVAEAELASRGSSRYFADRALEAARQWRFTPPRTGGRPLASEWLLRFEFDRGATSANPRRTLP